MLFYQNNNDNLKPCLCFLFPVCDRVCENCGTLDEDTCTCQCAPGWTGATCAGMYISDNGHSIQTHVAMQ